MWIVRLALRRPYTFVVVALLLLILGPIVILRTPTDIFPNINIPVVSIIWNYQGLDAQDMSNRIVFQTERALTTLVDDIQHIESQSLNGIAVVKVFFQPHAEIDEGDRAGNGHFPDATPAIAAGDDSAAGHYLQRIQRAHPSARAFRAEAFGAATV